MPEILVTDPTPLVGTLTRPVYSEDRCGYVGLGELELGERVRTAEGWATVEAMARWWGSATVHNLEVEAQHRFLAGAAGVVSHNAGGGGGGGGGSGGSCFGESCGGPGNKRKPPKGQAELPVRDSSGKVHGEFQNGTIDGVDPKRATPDELEIARDEIRRSLDKRREDMVDLGKQGGHGDRIAEEESLLRRIERELEDRQGRSP